MAAYSEKAQPFLDAIADAVFNSITVRDWLIRGTRAQAHYAGAPVLIDEQRAVRWRKKPTIQPFWANYHCGKDDRCTCRIAGSRSLESDAIFFFRNTLGHTLALHVEYKHPNEPFRPGQPEGYPLRAACFTKTHSQRPSLNAHDDWIAILFCGDETLRDSRSRNFDRVITHSEARGMIPSYPR
ncbi:MULTISPECIES: hypothetical protein [unclassified Methylosinus]|jgi:hypothetical protein|uniref:hypothetical protein n=1 Tax=unclassified Methylosinus TaxID=2624500 RepID=UPI0004649B72|nr:MULTISPECIES: hypothetical protein [unclassified Methylosinus]